LNERPTKPSAFQALLPRAAIAALAFGLTPHRAGEVEHAVDRRTDLFLRAEEGPWTAVRLAAL
jgi:hypothetical protein